MDNDVVVISMSGITKTFPGVKALSGVHLTLHRGEVLGLMGENGAGKSTLMNILGGIYQPDAGEIRIDGIPARLDGALDAQRHGLAFIHQELALEPYLSIAENVFLGRELRNRWGLVSRRLMEEESRPYLAMIGLDLDPSTKVYALSAGQQQMIEIAKALALRSRIIVMDEPSSSLSESEVRVLFEVVHRLRSQGIAIVFISHKMSEIFELTDNVMVLRDGEYITTLATGETNEAELVSLMVGRELDNYYHRTYNEPGEVALKVEHLTRGSRVQDCSFEVRRGEILGFYGLIGAGRSELIKAVMGIDKGAEGSVEVFSAPLRRLDPGQMLKHGVAFVPESRKTEGLFLFNTVAFNIGISVLERFIRRLRVSRKTESQIVDGAIDDLGIKTSSPEQRVQTLSGGNQQKIVLAKWLITDPEILILDEPTRGIDVGAKSDIYRTVNDLAAQGKAIVLISSEMNELINMSDRVAVMNNGRIVACLGHSDLDPDVVLSYAIGGAAA